MTINDFQDPNSLAMAANKKKRPLLVMTAAPAPGHLTPPLHIARELVRRGFEVIFMTTPEFRGGVEKAGAEYYPLELFWTPDKTIERLKYPVGLPRLVWDLKHIFSDWMMLHSATLKSLLEMVKERDADRDVVVVCETFSLAALPFMLGAPLPKGYERFPKVVNINVVPLMMSSIDCAAFGPGLPPDSTDSGRARNKMIHQLIYGGGPMKEAMDYHREALQSLGAKVSPDSIFFDLVQCNYDTTFQLCTPSLEYPRSDLDPSIRFAGALPKRPLDPNLVYPSWWPDIIKNATLPSDSFERKKVIPVSQGTIALDPEEVIIPTIKAFAGRSDVIVIAILGSKGASLPADFEVPTNTRVIDYFPYDAALEYADLFITNGGYGGMMHGIVNGIPMIMSGETEDKAEVSARGAYAGFAVNLRTQTPTPEMIEAAAERIFADPTYRIRAIRLQRENEDMDCFSIIERQIMAYAR